MFNFGLLRVVVVKVLEEGVPGTATLRGLPAWLGRSASSTRPLPRVQQRRRDGCAYRRRRRCWRPECGLRRLARRVDLRPIPAVGRPPPRTGHDTRRLPLVLSPRPGGDPVRLGQLGAPDPTLAACHHPLRTRHDERQLQPPPAPRSRRPPRCAHPVREACPAVPSPIPVPDRPGRRWKRRDRRR